MDAERILIKSAARSETVFSDGIVCSLDILVFLKNYLRKNDLFFTLQKNVEAFIYFFIKKKFKKYHSGLRSNNLSLYFLPIFLTLNEINFGNNKPTARALPVTMASEVL